MCEYLFRFYPLQPWFFGGERGFKYGPDFIGKDSPGNLNYFVKSNHIPQQTTILGAAKYILLKKKGIFKADWRYNGEWEEVKKIAGSGRLDPESSDSNGFFGAVNRLSPLLLNRGEHFWLPVPADHVAGEDKYKPMKYESQENAWGNFGKVGYLDGYDAKRGTASGWLNVETGEVLKNEEIFEECTRIGIEIPEMLRSGQSGEQRDEQKFYKQTYINFKRPGDKNRDIPDCFAVFVELNQDFKLRDGEHFEVMLGGRGSLFHVEVTELKNDNGQQLCYECIENKYKEKIKSAQKSIVLVSDALISFEELNKIAEYAVYETVPFRTFGADLSNKERPKLTDRGETCYYLLKRGSVIYPKKANYTSKDKDPFDNPTMRKLGYNRFVETGGEVKNADEVFHY